MARGERVIREFTDRGSAERALLAMYDEDDREKLHPDVAHWDEEGEFWSYDH